MTFGIDRGFAEVQILKKVSNILITFGRLIDIDKI